MYSGDICHLFIMIISQTQSNSAKSDPAVEAVILQCKRLKEKHSKPDLSKSTKVSTTTNNILQVQKVKVGYSFCRMVKVELFFYFIYC